MNYHNAPDYLLNPHHKITVALIGCGGTGSQVLSILARMNKALIALNHLGLHVTAYDDDIISEANIGRQLYSESEIGEYKATSLITRFNRFYGTKWEAINRKFGVSKSYNITITCVDDFDTRLNIGKLLKAMPKGNHDTANFYWLDFGNTNNTGQAILGTLFKSDKPLDCFDKWASLYKKPKKNINVPSCSLAEALEKQDLLINSSLANAGMQLLWRLFREGKTPYRGVMINLETLSSNPINV
jgi:PRTRC genetic system ThiF family protein